MSPKQCLGVTLKGQRCLKKVSDGSWCNYHISQASQKTHNTQKPFPKSYSKASSGSPSKTLKTPQNSPQKASHSSITTFAKSPTKPKSSKSSPQKQESRSGSPQKHHYSSPPTPAKYSASNPGFIYVYTLQSFLEDKSAHIKTRNLINPEKNKDKWVDLKAHKSKVLLIKVGMTTKTPAIRISQWEAKCNHKLQCLYPNSHDFKSTSSLLDHFRKLSLKSSPSQSGGFSTFSDNDKGFYVPRDVLRCERDIHGLLKSKFGRGEIHCTGCVAKTNAANSSRSGLSLSNLFSFKTEEPGFNVHNEWFPVPKNQIHEVYGIIDSVCRQYR